MNTFQGKQSMRMGERHRSMQPHDITTSITIVLSTDLPVFCSQLTRQYSTHQLPSSADVYRATKSCPLSVPAAAYAPKTTLATQSLSSHLRAQKCPAGGATTRQHDSRRVVINDPEVAILMSSLTKETNRASPGNPEEISYGCY